MIMHHAVRTAGEAGRSKIGKLTYNLGKTVPVPLHRGRRISLPISQFQGGGTQTLGTLSRALAPLQDMLTDFPCLGC
jgi:hypothetical protein